MGQHQRRGIFALVSKWRARDKHTGIDKAAGIPYTYAHATPTDVSTTRADVYRVETYIPFVKPTPINRNVHYVPGGKLDEFFSGWGEHGEIVVDIRPLTGAEALAELADFRRRADSVEEGSA